MNWRKLVQELIIKVKSIDFSELNSKYKIQYRVNKLVSWTKEKGSFLLNKLVNKLKNFNWRDIKLPKIKFTRRNIIRWSLFSILGLILSCVLFFFLVYKGAFGPLPSVARLRSISNYNASELYSGDNILLGKYYIENRTNVKYDQISKHVIDALIATEDARFYEHDGVDRRSMMRVFFKSLLMRDRSSGGGSTISQQLIKNLYPRKNHAFLTMPVNKLKEAITSTRLEKVYTKREILTLYLNTVPFGGNVFGIKSASRRFYSKDPIDLTIDEAAVLIGMLKANSYYNPRLYPKNALKRRNTVMAQMIKYGYINDRQYKELSAKPIQLNFTTESHDEGIATYFRENIRKELEDWCESHYKPDGTKYNLYTDGLKIYTSLDSRLQMNAERAVRTHLSDFQKVFDEHWKNLNPFKDDQILELAVSQSDRYKKLEAKGKDLKEIMEVFNKKTNMDVFYWDGTKEVEMTPLDSVRHYQKMLTTGMVAMNPQNGQLKAWVGGIDFKSTKYDHVKARRQVGSTFKPFVYLTALQQGVVPCQYFSNEAVEYEDYENWKPQNAGGFHEGYFSMQGGLMKSMNTISVKVLFEAGLENVVKQAHEMGIETDIPEVPSIALGTAEIPLLEMVNAYAPFVNGGYATTPSYLVKITDADGKVLENFEYQVPTKRVVDDDEAEIMIKMMEAVVDSGTGRALRGEFGLTNDLAGKTGTTQSHADGWFIGVTPNLITGVWVGCENPQVHFRTIKHGQGAKMALPIYGNFMSGVTADRELNDQYTGEFVYRDSTLVDLMDCPNFKENLTPFEGLFDDLFDAERRDSLRELRKQERIQRTYERRATTRTRQRTSSSGSRTKPKYKRTGTSKHKKRTVPRNPPKKKRLKDKVKDAVKKW